MYRLVFFITSIFLVLHYIEISAQHADQTDLTSTMVSKNHIIKADKYFKKGQDLTYWAKYDSANFYLKEASRTYFQLANNNEDASIWEKYINCYNIIGDNRRLGDRFKESKHYLEEALELGLKHFGEEYHTVATSFDNIGMLHFYKLESKQARKNVQKAIRIKRKLFGDKHLEVAKSYENLGFIEMYSENNDLALDDLKRALSIRIQLVGYNHLQTAFSYHSLGRYYYFNSDSDESFKYAEKALSIKLRLLGENHPETARTYTDFGNYYYQKKVFDKALMYNKKCADIHRKTFGENHRWVAFSYVNIADIYNKMGEYDKAVEYFQKVINIINYLHGESAYLAFSFHYLGRVYSQKGDYDMAIKYYNKSLNLEIKLGLGVTAPTQLGILYESIGKLFFKQKKYDIALDYYQKVLNILIPSFNNQNIYQNPSIIDSYGDMSLFRTLVLKAEALNKIYFSKSQDIKDIKTSLATYQLAGKLIDKMRIEFIGESSKLTLGEKAIPMYDQAIKVAYNLGQITEKNNFEYAAFMFSEKSKAALLTQNLQEGKAKLFTNISKSFLEKEKYYKTNLAYYSTEILKEIQKYDNRDTLKILDLKNKRFDLRLEYEILIRDTENMFPQYYDLKYKTEMTSVSDVQNSLNNKTALLEYFLGDSSIFIFTITNDNYDIVTVKRDSIFDSKLQSLLSSFKIITSQSDYLVNAYELYQILIKPVEQNISNKKKWIIIPDGELSLLPFEALLTKPVNLNKSTDFSKLNYLINQHEISYHYSATLYLKNLESKPTENYVHDFTGFAPIFSEENNTIAVNDNLSFSMNSIKKLWKMITRDGKNLEELNYSESEINEISTNFQPDRSQLYVHKDASEENFKDKINNTKFLHIATHGIIHNENSKLSSLVFSQPQDSTYKGDDGFLYSAETYNLNINADLLVLSACQTGTGKIAKGEGLMALTRGFLYSGANNIIASLWRVFDEHTSNLMIELYNQILSGKSYSAALREAKQKMISDQATARPQSWASFVLIGN